MDALLLALAVFDLLAAVVVGAILVLGNRQVVRLSDVSPEALAEWPELCVVVPARDEQRHIEAALESLRKQDYPALRLVLVDDRSTDQTGAILDRLAATDRRLDVVHVTELPGGWLGKNHALQLGADRCETPWLLFSDADVVMQPSVLRRAVGYAERHGIDHVAITPEVRMPSLLLEAFTTVFMIYFSAYFRPWKAKDPGSRAYIGVGAFNMIRRDVYRQLGGHRPIPMRPDDDVMLGKLVKKQGFRQELLSGTELMYVPWYNSLGEVIRGLEKNAFSGVDYRVWVVVGSSLTALLLHAWPFLAVWFTSGVTRLIYVAVILVLLALALACGRMLNVRPISALLFPLVVLLMVYIQWRTMVLTLARGGIRWRGTHYSLKQLKANRV